MKTVGQGPPKYPKKVPLVSFRQRVPHLEVFELRARPNFTPLDFNIFAFTQNLDWSLSDRFRFWHVLAEDKSLSGSLSVSSFPLHLTLHRLDKEADAFCRCIVNIDGEVVVWSNDGDYAENFFDELFVNVPPSFHGITDWKST